MVKIPYMRNILEKEERELEGEVRGIREERESERLGLEAHVFVFLADMGTVKRRGLRSNMAQFCILPRLVLGARWSSGGCT